MSDTLPIDENSVAFVQHQIRNNPGMIKTQENVNYLIDEVEEFRRKARKKAFEEAARMTCLFCETTKGHSNWKLVRTADDKLFSHTTEILSRRCDASRIWSVMAEEGLL